MIKPPKHSPAPWLNENDSFTIFDALGDSICNIEFGLEDGPNTWDYDAALIERAPELLAALDWALNRLVTFTTRDDRGEKFDLAVVILKRARGDHL